MKYERIEKEVFLERPNRFIAYALIGGQRETIHVKNTGRCAESSEKRGLLFMCRRALSRSGRRSGI